MMPSSNPLIEADFLRELREIEAESLGWQPLEPGAYLHAGAADATEVVVVGLPLASMSNQAVLLLAY